MKRILVGLDGSTRASVVLDTAVGLARMSGAKIVLFRGVGLPAEVPHDLWKLPQGSLIEVMEDQAKTYLAECAKRVPAELLERTQVAIGSPWQSICDTARSENVDLSVIGSHGYGALDRVLGTTAAKVVNHADRSVLVVRGPESLTKR